MVGNSTGISISSVEYHFDAYFLFPLEVLYGVYTRGSKRSHTGGKYVTCSGLTHSHWTLNALQSPPPSI